MGGKAVLQNMAALTAYVRISIPGGYLNPGDAAVATVVARTEGADFTEVE